MNAQMIMKLHFEIMNTPNPTLERDLEIAAAMLRAMGREERTASPKVRKK